MPKKKTSIHEELRVLEEASYRSLDEKRLTIDAWLVNKIEELEEEARICRQYHELENRFRGKSDEQECNCSCHHKAHLEQVCCNEGGCEHCKPTDEQECLCWCHNTISICDVCKGQKSCGRTDCQPTDKSWEDAIREHSFCKHGVCNCESDDCEDEEIQFIQDLLDKQKREIVDEAREIFTRHFMDEGEYIEAMKKYDKLEH